MTGLFTAFALFILLHSVPAVPAIRAGIIGRVGRPAYFAGYSAVSTALLVWLFYEALNTYYIELWEPARWQVTATFILAPLGLFLVISGLISSNPFSVTLRRDTGVQGAIVTVTRHPVLWGFAFWSTGHVLPNGDLRSLILFGGFTVFALGGIAMAERRARKRLGENWQDAVRGTAIIPLHAILLQQRPFRIDRPMLVSAIVTTVVTLCLLHGGHALLVGADPVAALQALE